MHPCKLLTTGVRFVKSLIPLLDIRLTKYVKNYAAIGEKYVAILEDIIEKNSLGDFDNAYLLPTRLKKGVAL